MLFCGLYWDCRASLFCWPLQAYGSFPENRLASLSFLSGWVASPGWDQGVSDLVLIDVRRALTGILRLPLATGALLL
jgi:hypothetical protein